MRIKTIAAGAALMMAVGGVAVVHVQQQEAAPTGVIETSSIFDLENPRLVAGFADAVLVGTVTGITATDATLGRTQYAFTVQKRYHGETAPSVTVEQLGYRDAEAKEVYQDESQPILEVGQRYVLAVTEGDTGVLTVIGGRHGAQSIGQGNEASVDAQWKDNVQRRQRPAGT